MLKYLLCPIAASLLACAHPIPANDRDLRHGATAYLLGYDNGMRVFVAPDPTSNLAEVDLRIWAGALDEPADKAGLAHLVEHAVLELAPGGRRIAAELAELALDWNAFTGPDFTHYRALVLADDVAPVLRLYGEIARGDCATLAPELFAREQAIVANEIRTRQDLLLLGERESLARALYTADHPYGHGLAGSPAGVRSFTRDDFCAFLGAHYDPSRAAVVVTGAVTLEQVKSLSDAALRPLVTRTPPPRLAVPALAGGARRARWSRSTPAVALAFPIPSRFSHASAAVDLLALAGEAALEIDAGADAGVSRSFVMPLGGDAARALVFVAEYAEPSARRTAEAALWKSIEAIPDIASHPYFEQILRQRQRRAILERVEPLVTRGMAYADYIPAPAGYGAFQGDLVRLDDLDPQSLRRVAARTFGRDQAVVLDLEPTRDSPVSPALPGARPEPLHDLGGEPNLHPLEALLAHRGAALPVHETTLSNGLRVVMVPSSLLPVIDVRLVLPVGNVDAPADSPLAAILTAYVATPRFTDGNGLWGSSAAFAGVQLDTRVEERNTVFSARALSIYSDFAFSSLRALAVTGEYKQSELDELRRGYLGLRARKPPAERAWDGLVQRLVGTCAELGPARESDLYGLDARSLARFRRRHYVPEGATLLVTGRFDPAFVRSQIEAAFGRWSGSRRSVEAAPREPAGAPGAGEAHVAVESVGDLRQVYLRIGLAVPADLRADAVSLALMREVLSLELRALRERLGASYAPDVAVERTCGTDMLVIAGDVEAARAAEVTRALAEVLSGLRAGRDFAPKFVRARQNVVRDLVAEASDSRALGDRLVEQIARRAAPDAHRALAEQAAATPPSLVARLLRASLEPARTAVLCYGRASAVEGACAAFRAAPAGSPTR